MTEVFDTAVGDNTDNCPSDRTFRRPIDWRCGSCTHVGAVRQINEDAVLARAEIGLWAVADGMGGHEVGDVASRMIVDALALVSGQERLSDFVELVERTLMDVNQQILDYADLMLDKATMGSTLVALMIRGRVGVCLWAGDSRLYRLRNHQLTQLSRDHSHVQELIEMGAITPEEATKHPNANVITRAVGVEEPGFIDINVFSAQIGDTFLLCSDGLYNTMDDADLGGLLGTRDAQRVAEALVQLSLERGAPDNVSVVVVKGEPGKFI
jgi:serine/threonine protein phosphatase PrpC